jgi:hypothetical protein
LTQQKTNHRHVNCLCHPQQAQGCKVIK